MKEWAGEADRVWKRICYRRRGGGANVAKNGKRKGK